MHETKRLSLKVPEPFKDDLDDFCQLFNIDADTLVEVSTQRFMNTCTQKDLDEVLNLLRERAYEQLELRKGKHKSPKVTQKVKDNE